MRETRAEFIARAREAFNAEDATPESRRKLWAEALRSGMFEQSDGGLCERRADGTQCYCGLGVLCMLATPPDIAHYIDGVTTWLKWEGQKTSVPAYIRSAVGLPRGIQDEIVDMNDAKRMSFSEIADFVDKLE